MSLSVFFDRVVIDRPKSGPAPSPRSTAARPLIPQSPSVVKSVNLQSPQPGPEVAPRSSPTLVDRDKRNPAQETEPERKDLDIKEYPKSPVLDKDKGTVMPAVPRVSLRRLFANNMILHRSDNVFCDTA